MADKQTPSNDKPKVGDSKKEGKGFWRRKFSNGRGSRTVSDGLSLAKFVALLLLAVAIISYVHGAETPPTLMSFLQFLRNAPRLNINALNIPKLDIGSGMVFDTLENAVNSILNFINLGNVGAVVAYNLLVTLWYVLSYLTIF